MLQRRCALNWKAGKKGLQATNTLSRRHGEKKRKKEKIEIRTCKSPNTF
jgi:hypothetical protein